MKERPILFSAPMVRAILDGRKSQTRRIVSDRNSCGNWKVSQMDLSRAWVDPGPSPAGNPGPYLHAPVIANDDDIVDRIYLRPWIGDRLWVRETWQYAPLRYCDCPQGSEASPCDDWIEGLGCRSNRSQVIYREDEATAPKWRPAIHMPRWASRITLEITGVRVERLQDISEGDAKAEGVYPPTAGTDDDGAHFDAGTCRDSYRVLWDEINGPGSWDANPWVWVIEFKRLAENVPAHRQEGGQ